MRPFAGLALLLTAVAGGTAQPPAPKGAPTPDAIPVVAVGVGKDAKEARLDGFQKAVQQAVGVYVEPKKKLGPTGDAVHEVATFSNGYIVDFEESALPPTADGAVRVRVFALVAREKLEVRLAKEGIGPRVPVDGGGVKVDGRPLFAETVTKQRRQKEAGTLLASALATAPSRAELVKGVKDLDERQEPKKVAGNRYEVVTRYQVEYDFDQAVAYGRWLDALLQKARFGPRGEHDYSHDLRETRDQFRGRELTRLRYSIPHNSFFTKPSGAVKGSVNPLYPFDGEANAYALLIGHASNGRVARMKWAVYKIDTGSVNPLSAVAPAPAASAATFVRALDGDGKTLDGVVGMTLDTAAAVDRIDLSRYDTPDGQAARYLYMVSPLRFNWQPYGYQFELGVLHTDSNTLQLSLDQLPGVRRIQTTLRRFDPGSTPPREGTRVKD